MSDDLIKRSDAIKAVWGEDINPSEDGVVFEAQSHVDRDIRLIPSADRPRGERRKDRGMIVIGYQGIGKSTLSRQSWRFIDLESSALNEENGCKADGWYKPYCMIAEWLSRQGYIVFVSSHKEVRDYLNDKCGERFFAIIPSENIKLDWIRKLRDRYEKVPSDKNFRAYSNAVARYSENIKEIKDDIEDCREITSMDYSLNEMIFRWKG